MDTKIEVKEEDPLADDVASQNETVFFTVKTNSDAVVLDNDCDGEIKTEIKSEIAFPDFCSQTERECFSELLQKQIKPETVTCSNYYDRNTKIEVGPQEETESLPEDHLMKVKNYNSDNERDSKIEVKEENPFADDVASQNETVFFTVKTNSGAVLLDNDCDGEIKTEIKSEIAYPDFCSQTERECFSELLQKQIKPETITCNNYYDKNSNTEVGPQEEREFLPGHVMKVQNYNSDNERDSKIEIKEEPLWLETETSSVYKDIKDVEFTPVKSPRSYSEAISGDKYGDLPFHSLKASRKNISISYGRDEPEYESDITKIPCLEKNVPTEQTGKCSDKQEIFNRVLLVDKVEKLYKCNICDKRFCSSSSLKRHNLIHQGLKPYKCDICEKCFTQLSTLKSHYLIHEGKKPHKCKICEKTFTELSNLKSHNLIHEGKKPHKCKICEKSFTQLSSWKLHNLIHEGKKPHKCEICEKTFTQLSSLKLHNFIHEGERPYKCEICVKSFTKLSLLKLHNLIHMGKKPHTCDVCEKKFLCMSDLKRHKLLHEGSKPYKCDVCEKSFIHLFNLRSHYLTHEGKMPHKCEICEETFTHLSSLKLHNLMHEGKKPHKCEVCEKQFLCLSDLKRHKLLHEGKKPHKCEICEMSFTHLFNLKSHNMIHEGKKPHKCEICEKSFTRLSTLKSHNLLHEH